MSDPRWTPAWKRLRVECYKRDKARDARGVHCGQPIDYSAKPSSTDDSYEPEVVCKRCQSLYAPVGACAGRRTPCVYP